MTSVGKGEFNTAEVGLSFKGVNEYGVEFLPNCALMFAKVANRPPPMKIAVRNNIENIPKPTFIRGHLPIFWSVAYLNLRFSTTMQPLDGQCCYRTQMGLDASFDVPGVGGVETAVANTGETIFLW